MNKSIPLIKDVIIVGAGAAGLMCAIEAGKRGRNVLVLEHNSAIGKKIRISGGGRCNFTNLHTKPENYLSQNSHFAKSALARFTPQDFCKLVSQYTIAFHEKKLGQLFCDQSAQNIIELLKKECQKHHVEILLDTKVQNITKTNQFSILTSKGNWEAQSLIIATGGLSIPALGASHFGYNVAKQFNIKINPCQPGLVPLTFKDKDLQIFSKLTGVSLDTIVSFKNIHFRENILFTHKGLSGPAILQISSYWQPKAAIEINLIPGTNMVELLKSNHHSKSTLKNFLKDYLPARFIETLCEHFFVSKSLNSYSNQELETIAKFLNRWQIIPSGTEGYAKAEVTVGGIDTNELSSKTMETKKVPNLYFIGEIVDVTGHLGGFNFQWAWASGFAAGQYV